VQVKPLNIRNIEGPRAPGCFLLGGYKAWSFVVATAGCMIEAHHGS
jgi:hypothetical protein